MIDGIAGGFDKKCVRLLHFLNNTHKITIKVNMVQVRHTAETRFNQYWLSCSYLYDWMIILEVTLKMYYTNICKSAFVLFIYSIYYINCLNLKFDIIILKYKFWNDKNTVMLQHFFMYEIQENNFKYILIFIFP